jgi:hypothetical protein
VNNIKHIIISVITGFICLSCSHDENTSKIDELKKPQFKWINGNYILKSSYGTYYENWENDDSLDFKGFGYYMDSTNTDTLFRQAMNLENTPKGIFMYFNVKNQNDNKTVEFKLTKEENNSYTFENPFRDYPSIIIYKILNDSTVNVVMRGFKNENEKKEDFIITKIK